MAEIDTWIELYARMLDFVPKFSQTSQTCRKKFEGIYKTYKEEKLVNSILGNNRHESKFYNAIDVWWHQSG